MKKLGIVLFVVCHGAVVGLVHAHTFGYRIETNGTATVTNYTGIGGSVTIPAEWESAPVATIGQRVFINNTQLTEIVLPDSLERIEEFAFSGCTYLTDVVIPDSVTRIDQRAFNGCTRVTNISLGRGVATLGEGVFWSCSALETISADADNPTFSSLHGVLFNKDQTHLVQYPLGRVGAYAIPETVIRLRGHAFFGCDTITSVSLPAAVGTIDNGAFRSCDALTQIVVSPDNDIFSSLEGVLFDREQSVLLQYPGGRQGSYTVPASVTNIAGAAFFASRNLPEVHIGSGVLGIGGEAFSSGHSLINIFVSADNPAFSDLDGVLFNKDRTRLLQYPSGRSGAYAIPHGVTRVVSWSFARCLGLTRLHIPETVTDIGNQSFFSCSGLRTVFFSGPPPALGTQAFLGCHQATMYYRLDAEGWTGAAFGGRPAAIWPEIRAFRKEAGGVAFDVHASEGRQVSIESCTDLVAADWEEERTATMPDGDVLAFYDLTTGEVPERFYRIVTP